MKKILALIIVFGIILSILPVFAQDADLVDYSNEVTELYTLGIISENPDIFDGQTTITRGKFAKEIVKLLNIIPEHIYYDDIFYYDVPEEHEYFLEIMYCAHKFWMLGFGDNTFLPENEITVGEAIKVLVSVLGYDYMAEAQGGYVGGYLAVANSLGLTKGLKASYTDVLTAGYFVKLFDNALTIPLSLPKGIDGDGNVIYEINDSQNILSVYFDCYKGTGVVTANDTVVIDGDAAGDNEIVVNNEKIQLKNPMDRNYIGRKVDYIYKMEKGSDKKELIAINVAGTKMVGIELKNIDGLNGNIFNYLIDEEKTNKLTISIDALFIKNGEIVVNPTSALFNKEKIGTVTFIKSGNSSDYDLVIINEYDSFVVGRTSETEYIISDFLNSSNSYDLDPNNKKVIIMKADGTRAEFKDIKVNSVVSVAESQNNEVIEVIISDKKVTGNYTQNNQTLKTVIIGEQELKLKNLSVISSVIMGSSVTAYLDCFSNVIYVEAGSASDYLDAVFVKGAERIQSNEKILILKFYTLDGLMKESKLSQKVIINGTQRKDLTEELLYAEVTKTGVATPFIKIKLDENDEIKNIIFPKKRADLLSTPSDDGFCILTGSFPYLLSGGHFGFNIYANPSTPLVRMPASVDNVTEEDFTVMLGTSSFTNTVSYNITAYFDSKYDLQPLYLQITDSDVKTQLTSSSSAGVVKRFVETVDKYEQPVRKIYLLRNGKEEGIILKNNNVVDSRNGTYYAKDLKPGDVIIASTDKNGYLNSYYYIYSVEQDKEISTSSNVTNTNSWGIVNVTGIRNGYIEFKDSSENLLRLKTSDMNIYTVSNANTASATVYIGKLTDLDEQDKVLYFMVNGVPKALFIYK